METIVINNKIRLVEKDESIILKIIVPAKNIQNMLELTGARLRSKTQHKASFNHHAGILFTCEIFVDFSKIKSFLKQDSFYNRKTENIKEYLNLFYDSDFLYYAKMQTYIDSVALYAFGDCSKFPFSFPQTQEYFYKNGKMIYFNKSDWNDFGEKRYIRNPQNGEILSNRKF